MPKNRTSFPFPLSPENAIVINADGTVTINGAEAEKHPEVTTILKIENCTKSCECNGCETGKFNFLETEPLDADIPPLGGVFYIKAPQNRLYVKYKLSNGTVRNSMV